MDFNDIHDKFKTRVSAMARGTTLPHQDQEAIVQEVFLAINSSIKRGTFPLATSDQENVVTRICVDKTSDLHRMRGRKKRQGEVLVTDVTKLSLERVAWDDQRDDSWETLAEILPCLPEKYREVVDMRLQDLSFAAIGERLGITENLANVRYFRAVEKLREENSRRLAAA